MSVLETLEIVIEADRSGLESQLKRAGQSITSFVSQMNNQQVSWTSILSKSITPALMASIASTFALAITQALQFQNALQTASLNTSDSFKTNSGGITDSVLNIASSTGQSASDVAQAMGILGNSYKDAATQLGILNDMSKIATIRNISLADAVNTLNPVLQNWGIDTVAGADDALTALNYATSVGKVQFDQLTDAIAGAGIALRGSISASDAALQLETLSNVAGETGNMVVSQFDVISKGIVDMLSPLNLLNGGFDHMQTLLKTGGLPAVFQQISDTLRQAGPAAMELGKQMGFTAEQVKVLVGSGLDGAFIKAKDAADDANKSVKSLNQSFAESMTLTKELGMVWNAIMTDILSVFNSLNKSMGQFVQDLASAKTGWDFMNAVGGPLQNETTPATLGIKSSAAGAGGGPIPFTGALAGAQPPVTNNYNITQNMNINAPAGSEVQTGEGIMKAAYAGLNR